MPLVRITALKRFVDRKARFVDADDVTSTKGGAQPSPSSAAACRSSAGALNRDNRALVADRQDIAHTRQIIDAGSSLGVAVHDHVSIGAKGRASLRALRLI